MTPTSFLEAVNACLFSIGEAPINSVESGKTADASLAATTLNEVSRQVQSRGWAFNTESGYPLPRASDGAVPVPSNTVRVTFALGGTADPVQRGPKLYDRAGHTYQFTGDQTAASIVLLLPFEELPENARRYVTVKACRLFQDRALGSQTLHAYTALEEQRAWLDLLAEEAEGRDYNALTSPGVQPLLSRR